LHIPRFETSLFGAQRGVAAAAGGRNRQIIKLLTNDYTWAMLLVTLPELAEWSLRTRLREQCNEKKDTVSAEVMLHVRAKMKALLQIS